MRYFRLLALLSCMFEIFYNKNEKQNLKRPIPRNQKIVASYSAPPHKAYSVRQISRSNIHTTTPYFLAKITKTDLRGDRNLYIRTNTSYPLLLPSNTFPIFHKEINGSYTRCQKKLPPFAITSNFYSVQKSKWVLKGKCLATRSNKTDEKYGLWWKTNRCMFYWYDKCGKTRCGIPYNIILNVLKYIFPQRSFFFFFFSLAPILVILIATSTSLLGTRMKEFVEVPFFIENA